ncbi:MAG TPA: hypothetical protein ENK99_04400 [Campylobacterales bacterium]|nr:hypothetical protein [Campylobacterales bacterium]
MKKLFSILNSSLLIIIILGCGYKPSSHFTPKTIGEKVYTEVDISLSDPQNAVLLKDALYKALCSRIKSRVTSKKQANSIIKVKYQSLKFIPLQYDKNGYVVYYQAHISLKFEFIKGDKKEQRVIIGRYEFPIRPSAIISTSLRFKAIEKGSKKALDEFIAYLESKGVLKSVN